MIDTPQHTSDSPYRAIFEGAPIAMWDEDFSGVKSLLDSLVQTGITDVGAYLREHRETVRSCVELVRVRHVNRMAREFYGAQTEQHLINALPSLFDDAALDTFCDEITAFANGATSFEADFSVTTLTGERRRVVMNVSRLGASSSNWSEVVVTFTDITDRRKLEQSLKKANKSLQRVNQHLERFAYAAAHDMREPLRTIALYAQLLQRQQTPQPSERAEKALRYILDNAERMETLVDDLLTFARAVDPQNVEPTPHATDPSSVLQEALSNLSTVVHQSCAQISIDSDMPVANMQAVHLRQVFQNLVSNAVKYRGSAAPIIRITGETVSGTAIFCVADNGIGISSDYHEQIFGIFKRLHGHEIEGNGIGLALCKKIVEDYGGRIWVESSPGEGSRFYFTIPQTSDLAGD